MLVFLLLLPMSNTCFAYDNSVKSRSDVAAWAQATWSGVFEDTAVMTIRDGGSTTIGEAACGIFSLSYARVKVGELTGTKDAEFMDTFKRLNKAKAFRDENPDWLIDYNKTDKICDDLKLATIDGVAMDRTMKTFSSGSDIMKDITELYNAGYYVIACVVKSGVTNGHYIFMDQPIDDGKDFIIGDSGFPGRGNYNNGSVLKFSDLYEPENINHITVLESRKGNKANEQPSIYTNSEVADKLGIEKGKKGTGANKSEEEVKAEKEKSDADLLTKLNIKDEWDLVGMKEWKGLLSDGAFMLEIPESIEDRYKGNVELISESIKDRKSTVWGVIRVIVESLGIFLLAYTTLFVAFYIFDLVNTIITFSLLSILTLGKYRVYKKDEVNRKSDLLKVKSVVYLDLKGMLLRCLIMFLISWAIISGAIYAVAQEIINIVVNIVG